MFTHRVEFVKRKEIVEILERNEPFDTNEMISRANELRADSFKITTTTMPTVTYQWFRPGMKTKKMRWRQKLRLVA